jgi:hypothetical protein
MPGYSQKSSKGKVAYLCLSSGYIVLLAKSFVYFSAKV